MSSKLGPFKASQICFLIPILLGLYALAFADYHYASHTGSNTYPYTSWETAADSITAAMRAADPYDTVYIGAGDYNEIVNAFREDTCLTFIGAGIDSTHVWQDAAPNTWLPEKNTIFRDIFFEAVGTRGCIQGYGGASIAAYHCKFRGLWCFGAMGPVAIVEDCEFYDFDNAIQQLYYTGVLIARNNYMRDMERPCDAISGDRWSFALFENNITIRDEMFGLYSYLTDRCDTLIFRNNYFDNFHWGMDVLAPKLAIISNNIVKRVYDQQEGSEAFTVLYNQEDRGIAAFRNNAVTECRGAINADYDHWTHDSLYIGFNGFWGNSYGNLHITNWNKVDTIGNIEAYPMYVNPESFNVHLQEFSPFIDAGDPLISDVDGSRSDIGVFGGPGGSSYDYLDLPPRRPDSIAYQLRPDTIVVCWRLNHEADFNRYIVWRDTLPGFSPWAGNIISEPNTNLIYDTNWDNSHDYYYRVAAYDNQWNLSELSNELMVLISGVDGDNSGVEIPSITAIESNYPNPFNSSTTIVYLVANLGPIPAQINIALYDIQGRQVRNLVDEREEIGRHTVTWDGKDDFGNELASGIYFARITQWKVDYLSRSQKLVLVR
jgi:hypothetical protein